MCIYVSNNDMDPNIPAIQSAELPVLEPEAVKLVQMIDNGASYNTIFRQLCNSSTLVANAASPADIDTKVNRTLLHTMPPPLLRSLLMGTLAPHFCSKDAKRDNWHDYVYNDAYAGAYAACLHIHPRRGGFLSQRETRQLIEALKKYSKGVRLYDDLYRPYRYVLFPRREAEALEFTQIIDDELRQVAHWDPNNPNRIHHLERPRFAKTDTSKIGTAASTANANIEALIRMFESRCTIDKSDQANPDLDVFQLQSPIMVGNAGCINAHIANHLTNDHGSGGATSKVFALTMSYLKHMGLDVKSLAVPISIAWEEDQIDPAEVLGMILGNSRLPGHGYNVKMPGTRGIRVQHLNLDQAKQHVFYWKTFLKRNVEQSVAETRDEAVAEKKSNRKKKLANACKEIDKFKCLLEEQQVAKMELEKAKSDWQEALKAAQAKEELIQDAHSKIAELGDRYDKLIKFSEAQ
ncbi:hypothetical protein F5Y09DRAFT_324250 [Xylaria sp. FL1042]|nr:hypothetical protein F5Y09DRAFT_324250 [Xylaria sp. FL1042]